MFEGFETGRFDVGDASAFVRYGGDGPPVLLLHGHPRTRRPGTGSRRCSSSGYTVVCPDLRGYGRSRAGAHRRPRATRKRAVAGDMLRLCAGSATTVRARRT